MTVAPYDWGQARTQIAAHSAAQKAAEKEIRDAYRLWAEAERTYRRALAQKIVEMRAERPSVPVTIIGDLARGDGHIADLKFRRDVKAGVKEAAQSAIFRHTADRRELEQLISWSMRVAPDGQYEAAA